MLSTDKLKDKEVINIHDGKSLGYVFDIEVDLQQGKIQGIIVPVTKGFRSVFSKNDHDYVITWDKVRTVGDDVILVDID